MQDKINRYLNLMDISTCVSADNYHHRNQIPLKMTAFGRINVFILTAIGLINWHFLLGGRYESAVCTLLYKLVRICLSNASDSYSS